MTRQTTDDPIRPILAALANVLQQASQLATEAFNAELAGERNQAIGTLFFDDELQAARALFDTAFVLHRRAGKGGAP